MADYNPDQPEITVAGLPAKLGVDGGGYYATATFQNVYVQASPLVVYFNPPVATIEEAGFPALLGFVAALASGAIIQR